MSLSEGELKAAIVVIENDMINEMKAMLVKWFEE